MNDLKTWNEEHQSVITVGTSNNDNNVSKNMQTIEHEEKRQNQIRTAIFFFALAYALLFAGAFFGWGPMQLMLEENGAFETECEISNKTDYNIEQNGKKGSICEEQTIKLLNVHLIAQFALVAAPFFGFVSDKYGTIHVIVIMGMAVIVGLLLIIIASLLKIDNLIYLGFFLIGIMMVLCSTVTMQIAMLFQENSPNRLNRYRVVSLVNSLFDAGVVTYLGLWAINESIRDRISFSFEIVLTGYLGLAIIVFVGTAYLWTIATPEKTKPFLTTQHIPDDEDATNHIYLKETIQPTSINCNTQVSEITMNQKFINENETTKQSISTSSLNKSCTMKNKTMHKSDYILIAERLPHQQLLSSQYICLVLYFTIHTCKNVFALTTARDFLAYLGDDETGNRYLSIFTLIMPLSLIGVPFVDFVIRNYGYYGGLNLVNFFGIGHGLISTLSSNLNIQVVGFVFLSFYRCFLYSVSFSFGPTFLGENVIGRGTGWLVFMQGLFSLINIPMKTWGVYAGFFSPNLLYLLLMLPCLILTWIMGRGIKQEAFHKRTSSTILEA